MGGGCALPSPPAYVWPAAPRPIPGCGPPNPPASVWRSPAFFVLLVQFYHGGRLRPAQPPRRCFAKPDVLGRSCSVLSWGGLRPPYVSPRLCLAGCAPPASVWRSPAFFVVLVQFYHGGRLRPAQPPRLDVLRRSSLCLAETDVLGRSCSVLSWAGGGPPQPMFGEPAYV